MKALGENKPIVSIIVPVYNAEHYIREALTSVLQENRISIEIIVVDDHSTDQSMRKVRSLQDSRVRVINNQGKGISQALNTGISNARGKYVARCDADDVYPPNRLFQQLTWLEENSDFVAICGTYSAIDARGRSVVAFQCGETAMEITPELQLGVTRTHLGTFMMKTSLLRDIGGFRDYFLTGEDIDLQLRISEHGRVWYNPTVNYLYRLHATSTTHIQGSIERDFFNQLARELQRQRQAQGKDVLEQGDLPPVPTTSLDTPLTVNEHIQGLLLYRAWEEHRSGQRKRAIATGIRALVLAPIQVPVWKSVLSLILKSPSPI